MSAHAALRERTQRDDAIPGRIFRVIQCTDALFAGNVSRTIPDVESHTRRVDFFQLWRW